jgi:response regulator RpfG family c-di-GMP phosphodiesterase
VSAGWRTDSSRQGDFNVNPARQSSANRTPLSKPLDYAQDTGRKQVLWLAIALIALLGLALVVLVAYGLEVVTSDYTEPLMLIGLLALLTTSIAYFADREREYRSQNRSLIKQLHDTARALDERVARLNKLCETSTHLAGALNIDRISDLVVEALVEQVRADAASMVLLDKSEGKCVHTNSKGSLAEQGYNGDSPEEVARAAVEQEGPSMRWVENNDGRHGLQAWGALRAVISAPLKISEIMGGALAAIRHDSFSHEDLNLLTTLANMAGKAIESAELHEQLRQSYFRTLHTLARSLAVRDPYTSAHSEAVAWLACRLAERLDLGKEEIQALQAYGPLHDLGKIGIPDSVLLKHGPLTDDEMEMCRKHTTIGEEIIRPLNPGPAVLQMIRHHHERWDGRGYPDGLKGEEIPLLARIVGLADAFRAMVSDRAYRGGTTPSRAVQEINALAGAQFDPTVARALLELWECGELTKFKTRQAESADGSKLISRPCPLSAPPSFAH